MPTLNWLERDSAVRAAESVPFRVLASDTALSADDPGAENLLIQGDNLKALIPFYAGRVKCFAIDPSYNTRSAFEHYDDNLEHSTWLSMMYPRLELMRDIGRLWEQRSGGQALFLWAIKKDSEGRALQDQLKDKIGHQS